MMASSILMLVARMFVCVVFGLVGTGRAGPLPENIDELRQLDQKGQAAFLRKDFDTCLQVDRTLGTKVTLAGVQYQFLLLPSLTRLVAIRMHQGKATEAAGAFIHLVKVSLQVPSRLRLARR